MAKKRVIDESKLRRQEQFIQTWVNSGGIGTLEAVTAFGKTFTTILIIKKMLEKNPSRSFMIVVPSIQLKEQWINTLLNEKISPKNFYVTVINGATIHNQEFACTCLILDEVHLYLNGPIFSRIFELVKYKFILGLSATIDRNSIGYNLLRLKAPIIDTITQQEADLNGWVANYKEFVLTIQLDEMAREQLDQINSKFKTYFAKFNHDFDLAMKCKASKPLAYRFAIERGWKDGMSPQHPWSPQRIAFYSVMFNRAMLERKEFLYNYRPKVDLVREIVEKFNVKSIIFSESTKFADEVAEAIGSKAISYHSNLPTELRKVKNAKGATVEKKFGKDRLKKEAIQKFEDNRSKITVLSTAKALNQGTDLPSAQLAIVASYSSSELTSIQRRGRVIRKYVDKNGVEKKAVVVYFAIEGSQEETWLKKALANSKPIWTNSIDYIIEKAFTKDSFVEAD